jgi:hypothetical protein
MALSVTADHVGVDPKAGEAVLAVIADWNTGRWIATIVCFADGTTSMYLSTGGGIIGAGERAEVRSANRHVLEVAGQSRSALEPVREHPLPPDDSMRFGVVTTTGPYAATARNGELRRAQHPLASLHDAVQDVIARMRENVPNP